MKAKSPSSSANLHINTAFASVTAAVVDLSKRVAEGEFEVPTASKGSIDSPLMLRAREMRSSFLDNLGLGDSLEKKNIEIKEFKMSLRLKDRLLVEQTELREASVRHLDVLRVDLTKRLTLAEEGRDRALHRCLISEVPPPLCDSNSPPVKRAKRQASRLLSTLSRRRSWELKQVSLCACLQEPQQIQLM